MTILHIIIAWLAVFAGFLVWARIRENVQTGRRFWDFGSFNFLVSTFGFAVISWIFIAVFHPEPKLDSAEEKIKFGDATNQPWISNKGLWEKIDSTPANIDLHFQLLQNHFAQNSSNLAPPDPRFFQEEQSRIYIYYTDLSSSPDSALHDIGHIMLANYFLSQKNPDYQAASSHLQFVDDPTRKYVNYLAGKILLLGAGSSLAAEHFYSEVRNKGYKKGAYEYLAVLYDLTRNDSALRSIVYSGASEFIPEDVRARVYYQDRDVKDFYIMKIKSVFVGINAWGISGGIGILALWLFFLWNLTFISRVHVVKLLVPILSSALLAMSSWWLYAFYKHGIGFWMNGEILNDVVFSFAGIGTIEELVKLIPFLIILHFTNIIRKPIDYIVVASACGLGFAVFENLMYIANYGLDVIHSRALTSSLSHMACSGIVAYGFVLRRYRWPQRWWILPAFFLLAVGAHGFYDFWLLNDHVRSLGILTLLFFLSLIVVYFSFINNALNQSVETENDTARFSSAQITSVLAGSFILLFTFEYLAICLVYGTTYGNASITTSFLSGGYLVFFISVRMAAIRIEPGKWNPIDLLSGILPSQMFKSQQEEE